MLTPDPQALVSEQVAALCTEAGLGAILDGIGEGFYAVDRDWRIILFNNEAARYFGCEADRMVGRKLWELFPNARDTALGRLFEETMASRATIRSETESVIFGSRWLAYRLFPLGDGMGIVFRDVTVQKQDEAQRDLLIKELEHRVKNILSTVQSIASQTFRLGGVDPAIQRGFDARLVTLSNITAMLTEKDWDSAEIHEVIRGTVRPHNDPERKRFTIEGPELRLGPKSAVAFSMAVHELCTNAIKYGALSVPGGHVDLRWHAEDGRFGLIWRERGGPAVTAPERKGFGSRMIERALAMQLSGTVTIDYQPLGVVCTIAAPLEAIHDTPA